MGFEHHYGALTGCLVRVNERWVRLDTYREVCP